MFFQEDGAWSPSGGQSTWPYPGELSVCLQWFYSAPLSSTAGCTPGQCGTAKADCIEKPKAHSDALIKGAGCFWFTLLSFYIFTSQIGLLKVSLFFLVWKFGFSRTALVQPLFAVPKKDIVLLLWFMSNTLWIHIICGQYLFWSVIKPDTKQNKGGKRGNLAKGKQLDQVPDSSQACELNKAHCIDLRVIHYLFWM